MITVFYQNRPIFLYPVIAARMGLSQGQQLAPTEWKDVVEQNAAHFSLLVLGESRERN